MNTSQVAVLRHFPNFNEWAFIEIDRLDKRIYHPMKPERPISRSDKSYCVGICQGLVLVIEASIWVALGRIPCTRLWLASARRA
jgi:hypothetical protein